MTRQEAGQLVSVIMAACPGQSARVDGPRAAAMVDAFASLLADLTYEQCNAAVRVLLQTRSWMPSVADIRSTALELARGPAKAGAEAWGSVLRAIREQGVYRRPGTDFVFHDPVTARCVVALGWEELCNSENTIADRARFVDAYDQIAAQDRKESVSPQLAAARDARAVRGETNGTRTIADAVARLLPTKGGDA